MEPLPDARPVPVAQPAPAGDARPAAHLGGRHPPGDARLQDEQDAAERGAVGDGRPAAERPDGRGRQERLDGRPEFIGDERFCHTAILAQQNAAGYETCSKNGSHVAVLCCNTEANCCIFMARCEISSNTLIL